MDSAERKIEEQKALDVEARSFAWEAELRTQERELLAVESELAT